MRAFAIAAFALAGLALSVPQAAVAAELELGAACPPNTVWDDGYCVRVRPRAYAPGYAPAPVVVEEPVYVAPRPAVVIGAPLVVAPALGFYYGPRWGWGSRTVVVRHSHGVRHGHFAHRGAPVRHFRR